MINEIKIHTYIHTNKKYVHIYIQINTIKVYLVQI